MLCFVARESGGYRDVVDLSLFSAAAAASNSRFCLLHADTSSYVRTSGCSRSTVDEFSPSFKPAVWDALVTLHCIACTAHTLTHDTPYLSTMAILIKDASRCTVPQHSHRTEFLLGNMIGAGAVR